MLYKICLQAETRLLASGQQPLSFRHIAYFISVFNTSECFKADCNGNYTRFGAVLCFVLYSHSVLKTHGPISSENEDRRAFFGAKLYQYIYTHIDMYNMFVDC